MTSICGLGGDIIQPIARLLEDRMLQKKEAVQVRGTRVSGSGWGGEACSEIGQLDGSYGEGDISSPSAPLPPKP